MENPFMKAAIHPNYTEATVTCSCGNTFTTRSTRPQLRTDLCSVCHPFFTGEQRIVDTAGQVERFTRRQEAAAANAGRLSKRQRRIQARSQSNAPVDEADAAETGEDVTDEVQPETVDASTR
jgi:large subunit ribosomal protein L31